MLIIIGIFVGLVLVLPRFLIEWSFIKSACQEITDKPFTCPNCGNEFYVNWYKMWFKRHAVYLWKSAKLKCPNCGITDMCNHNE